MKSKHIEKLLRILLILLGFGIGYALADRFLSIFNNTAEVKISGLWRTILLAGSCFCGSLVFLALSNKLISKWKKTGSSLETHFGSMPISEVITATLGLIFGLIVAALLSQLFGFMGASVLATALSAILYLSLGAFGFTLGKRRSHEITHLLSRTGWIRDKIKKHDDAAPVAGNVPPKVLDSSVLIDGRILNIWKAGFLEGTVILPEFILHEMQLLADSSDEAKHAKGRRGLEFAEILQKEMKDQLMVDPSDREEDTETDTRLLNLCKRLGGTVVTGDYNLNKVARITGIKVMNLNELAGALRLPVSQGQTLSVRIVREGREAGQGVAFLEDGTMVVIENGRGLIGSDCRVTVTSVLQTNAGRMAFAKCLEEGTGS